MPPSPVWQVLSQLSFTAQQLLLPVRNLTKVAHQWEEEVSFDIKEKMRAEEPTAVWYDYYMKQSSARSYDAHTLQVTLGSNCNVVESKEKAQPANVRWFSTPSVGVWHPDRLIPRLFWDGGSSQLNKREGLSWFNPFIPIPVEVLVHRFTERLPEDDKVCIP